MFTRAQRHLLQVTALLCAGFIVGISVKSPSVNPLLDRDVDAVEQTSQSARNAGTLERVQPARSASDEPRPWLDRGPSGDGPPPAARRPFFDQEHAELRVVTVFNGPSAREFVVPRE